MSEEDIVKIITYMLNMQNTDVNVIVNYEAIGGLLELYKKQQKEIKELSEKVTENICKGVEEEVLEEYRQTIEKQQKEIKALNKGVRSLMESRKKWKNRYYKLRKELKKQELEYKV